jgi:hypothetical protein
LGDYLANEVGAAGLLLFLFKEYLRRISSADGVPSALIPRTFVYDSVFSGVTRRGTSQAAFDSIYALIDSDHPIGQRRISNRQLRRFAAILRTSYRETKVGLIRREIGIAMAAIEWAMIIRSFGVELDGRVVLDEQTHWSLVEARLSQPTKKRSTRVIHLLPGVLAYYSSWFHRLDPDDAAIAIHNVGEAAIAGDVD